MLHLLFLKDGRLLIFFLFFILIETLLIDLKFIPWNSETEWLFSTPQGRKKLSLSAKHDRLAIVSMHRGHLYTSWDDVKEELSSSIRNFAPSGTKNLQVNPSTI